MAKNEIDRLFAQGENLADAEDFAQALDSPVKLVQIRSRLTELLPQVAGAGGVAFLGVER